MIKYRQKEYTIQEGHYSGPKSIKRIPGAIKVITKSVLAGLGIGTVAGAALPEETAGEGAKKGAKVGFWAGVALKTLINKFHKPMSSVKFEKVDKAIRKEYGFKEFSGMIYGDTKEKRDDFNSHFSFNDLDFLNYKINVLIQKKRITFYTVDLEKKDLDLLNESLNYFCYKYYGMEYSSKLLNEKRNSYSVSIIFTNYEAIAKFFIEIANSLNIKINVLDKDSKFDEALLKTEKTFSLGGSSSLPVFDKYDMMKILGKGGLIIKGKGFKTNPGDYIMDSISEAVSHLGNVGRVLSTPRGIGLPRKTLNNIYLEKCFKDMGFRENFDYTVKKNSSPLNLYLHEGYLILCSGLNKSNHNKLKKNILDRYNFIKTEIKGSVTLYTYMVESKTKLDNLLRDIINLNIKPNIYSR